MRRAPAGPLPVDSTDAVVRVSGLRKSYSGVEAVAGVDLEVRRGEIFAFLGPNGAGMTTTVEILEGSRTRTSGEVSVLGVDPAHGDGAWRNRIGGDGRTPQASTPAGPRFRRCARRLPV